VRRPRPRPRTLAILGVCLALLAALAVGLNAYRWKGSVTVLANWTGPDEKQFRAKVIDPFEKKYRIHVIYQGSSAESQVLAADVETGTPLDVAILPGPGELAGYASRGQLKSLDDLVGAKDFSPTWMPKVAGPGPNRTPHTYWVPVKAGLKSMVWHPATLSSDQLKAVAATPSAWCLGMASGATSGWPGTDWVEDILLQQAGRKVYSQWATGNLSWSDQRVRRAWTTWGALVGAGTPRISGALTTEFDKASAGVAKHPATCRLEHQASFVRSAWQEMRGTYSPSAEIIPNAGQNARSWEISGDLAAMLRDTSQARRLIRYLASPAVQRSWNTEESGFSANKAVLRDAHSGDQTAGSIASTLSDRTAELCWDASDAMPSAMREAFSQAALSFLATGGDPKEQLTALEAVRSKQPKTGLTSVCGRG
jgi:alpha-glucoside transport system substrate-binding protein